MSPLTITFSIVFMLRGDMNTHNSAGGVSGVPVGNAALAGYQVNTSHSAAKTCPTGRACGKNTAWSPHFTPPVCCKHGMKTKDYDDVMVRKKQMIEGEGKRQKRRRDHGAGDSLSVPHTDCDKEVIFCGGAHYSLSAVGSLPEDNSSRFCLVCCKVSDFRLLH